MNRSASLYVNHNPVTSPIGLLGTDENMLSFALGYTFQQCLPLLQLFLKHIGISGVQKNENEKDRHLSLQNRRKMPVFLPFLLLFLVFTSPCHPCLFLLD